MATPCIFIASCSQFSPQTLVKEILKCDSLTPGNKLVENIVAYSWCIDTKYYRADVQLCTTDERTIGDQTFAESVEAFVVYFDPDEETTYSLVKSWVPYLEQINPEVRILVCDRCSDNHKVGRLEVQTWCIDNGFELVELNPELDTDSELEDDFAETTGVNRIIQALEAHTWPNLQLKDNPQPCSPYIRQLMQEEYEAKNNVNEKEADCDTTNLCDHSKSEDVQPENQSIVKNDVNVSGTCSCASGDHTDRIRTDSESDVDVLKSAISKSNKVDKDRCMVDSSCSCDCTGGCESADKLLEDSGVTAKVKSKKSQSETKEEKLDTLLPSEDMALLEALDMEDNGGESFEKLFESFATMKDKANALPPAERKKYAEHVAVAFWRAMGGDEDEIGDLSDSD